MITDAQQTKMLREARLQEKRSVKELNNIGRRLEWVRAKLEINQRQVCEGTGIPASSYCGREAGIRPELAEEFVVLAMFFNKLWRMKFTGPDYPFYNGQEIKKIGTEWLMFGHSDLEANAEAIIEEYRLELRQLEEAYFLKEAELLRQLDMFKLEEK